MNITYVLLGNMDCFSTIKSKSIQYYFMSRHFLTMNVSIAMFLDHPEISQTGVGSGIDMESYLRGLCKINLLDGCNNELIKTHFIATFADNEL